MVGVYFGVGITVTKRNQPRGLSGILKIIVSCKPKYFYELYVEILCLKIEYFSV